MPRSLNCLLTTHHFIGWTGSELVLIDLAEALLSAGCNVTVYAALASPAIVEAAFGDRVKIIRDPGEVELKAYDSVYVQHQMVSRLMLSASTLLSENAQRPYFVFNHLSSFEPFEYPGPFLETDIADEIWANSKETTQKLAEFGPAFQKIDVVPNPAPKAFTAKPRPKGTPLKRLLSVSNHLPENLEKAFELLAENGVEVTRLGRGVETRQITPDDLHSNDAIVTIGKTVQYALCARRAVFCYDHFGGPGWLTYDTFQAARDTNFSGRSGAAEHTPKELCDMILQGFEPADRFVGSLSQRKLSDFQLDKYVKKLLVNVRKHIASPQPAPGAGRAPEDVITAQWATERELYHLLDQQYAAHRAVKLKFSRFRRQMTKNKQKSGH
jgi:hypothetical protein